MTGRTCRECGATKPLDLFPLYGYKARRRQPCKACWSARENARQKALRAAQREVA